MKLPKYVFYMHSAIEKVSKRFDVPPPPMSYMFILYTIQYLPHNCSQNAIIRHAKKVGYPISLSTLSQGVRYLSENAFIHYQDNKLSLAPQGREYLSAIRRYLLNKRL